MRPTSPAQLVARHLFDHSAAVVDEGHGSNTPTAVFFISVKDNVDTRCPGFIGVVDDFPRRSSRISIATASLGLQRISNVEERVVEVRGKLREVLSLAVDLRKKFVA